MKTITVKVDTRLKDLKPGDLVMTGELMRVVRINDSFRIDVVDVRPQCSVCKKGKCAHEHVHYVGWGQHGLVKVLKRSKR